MIFPLILILLFQIQYPQRSVYTGNIPILVVRMCVIPFRVFNILDIFVYSLGYLKDFEILGTESTPTYSECYLALLIVP